MALTTEIWINAIIGDLFGTASAITKSVDHSDFVDNKIVHVPNAGAPSKIAKNATQLPLTVSAREDIDLTYPIDDYKIYPMLITNAEQVELSYNKRQSVVSENRAHLYDTVSKDTFAKWIAGAKPVAKGKKTVKEWILDAARQFATDSVPQADRYVMLSPDSYYTLLDELSSQEQFAFSASADSAQGILGSLYGFNIVSEYLLPDKVEMLAWHKNSLSRAMSPLTLFENEKDPTYYGDIISGELRAGGAVIRKDLKGVYVIGDTTASNSSSTPSSGPKEPNEDHVGV